jgi:hypothetical protein
VTHYFTFGYSQVHQVTGADLGNRWVAIEAPDPTAAREEMFARFRSRWAFQYEALEEAGGASLGPPLEALGLLEKEPKS